MGLNKIWVVVVSTNPDYEFKDIFKFKHTKIFTYYYQALEYINELEESISKDQIFLHELTETKD
jgi:hypothetical protein